MGGGERAGIGGGSGGVVVFTWHGLELFGVLNLGKWGVVRTPPHFSKFRTGFGKKGVGQAIWNGFRIPNI